MRKFIIYGGKPTHFRPNNENKSACGVVCPEFAGYDARDCDCLRCIRSHAYRVYMGLLPEKERDKRYVSLLYPKAKKENTENV